MWGTVTQLEEVLAEEWVPHETRSFVRVRHLHEPITANTGRALIRFQFTIDLRQPDASDEELREANAFMDVRRAVTVLGKDALALLLKHEFPGGTEGTPSCPECGMGPPFMLDGERVQGHKPDCRWGALCEAARKLG